MYDPRYKQGRHVLSSLSYAQHLSTKPPSCLSCYYVPPCQVSFVHSRPSAYSSAHERATSSVRRGIEFQSSLSQTADHSHKLPRGTVLHSKHFLLNWNYFFAWEKCLVSSHMSRSYVKKNRHGGGFSWFRFKYTLFIIEARFWKLLFARAFHPLIKEVTLLPRIWQFSAVSGKCVGDDSIPYGSIWRVTLDFFSLYAMGHV